MGKGLFWVVLLLAMVGTCCCWWACPPQERSALIRFKQELLDPDDLMASWKGLYCCSWKGITCHRRTGHVVSVDLQLQDRYYHSVSVSVRNSSSQIFPALFQLQHLEYLDLSQIDLSPLPIPAHLPSLKRLTHLSLRGCGLTGRIPSEIGNMSALEFLDISYNSDLSGPIPSEIGNMTGLKFLDISGNSDLEMRQSSSWIQNLRGLEHLGLARVNMTIDVAENVASLANLTSLYMSELPVEHC